MCSGLRTKCTKFLFLQEKKKRKRKGKERNSGTRIKGKERKGDWNDERDDEQGDEQGENKKQGKTGKRERTKRNGMPH